MANVRNGSNADVSRRSDLSGKRTLWSGFGKGRVGGERIVRSWWLERVFGRSEAENLILCYALRPLLMLYVVPVIKADWTWNSGSAR